MDVRFRTVALLWIGLGVLLRLAIVFGAENRLGSNESTVAVMALDVLEGKAFPFFYYGNTYNGGAALESWLGALAFAVGGPAAIPLKLTLLSLWTAAAGLFANLLGRVESRERAIIALGFFALGTPFFLEWSLKARGGFAETVLFSTALLYLAAPPGALRERVRLQGALFGGIAAVAYWASEMILALLPCIAIWLVLRHEGGPTRRRAAISMLVGLVIGLLALVVYNATHDWQNARESVLFALLDGSGGGSTPLSPGELALSARFVLGPTWPVLGFGIAVGAYRVLRTRETFSLGHVALLHLVLYLGAYVITGQRFLPMPPSRVLYALYPSLAIVLAYAVEVPPRSHIALRGLASFALLLWLVSMSGPVAHWIQSGVPRETGSWRGSFSLFDAAEVDRVLVEAGVRTAYANMWTAESLRFATRVRAHRDGSTPLSVTHALPKQSTADAGPVGIVLLAGNSDARAVETFLRDRSIHHRRVQVGALDLFTAIDASEIYRRDGLPTRFAFGDLPPLPREPDGFN